MIKSISVSFFKIHYWLGIIFLASGLILMPGTEAQAGNGPTCGVTADCQAQGLPPCFQCILNVCTPQSDLCNDDNECTEDLCVLSTNQSDSGCVNLSLALQGDPDLPPECYVCEPTENNVTLNNGVCDQAAGEDCNNSPLDCLVPGEICGTPTPPQTCDAPSNPLLCADGDRCTDDICNFGSPDFCSNPPKACEPVADGCCPVDPASGLPCLAPPPGMACPINPPDPTCDPDCWPVQSCGDEFVEPPETCDDGANAGNAGVKPDGVTPVTDAECRDPGTAAECTYCGDNLIQAAAGEECDGTALNQCGEAGCDVTTCLCNEPIQNLCLTGSGNIWDTIRTDCGDCSFNPHALSNGWRDYVSVLALLLLVGGLYTWRRRKT